MKKFKVENDFMIGNYRCVILGLYMGHRCGYVGLPKEHKYVGLDEFSIDVAVHGGITYSDYEPSFITDNEDRYWIGFDCAHCGDKKDLNLIKELCDEPTLSSLLEIETRYPTGEKLWTKEDVENELKSLVSQLD